jgi:error-prone DNA polymerase
MTDPFVHLHVASGYSMRYGASHPRTLVERAADHGMDALALTDRDGVYGAVRFVTACASAGIRPLLGVDLAVRDQPAPGRRAAREPPRRSPARGGAFVDDRWPRITVLADGKAGWASLCRLVSATHLAGERGRPVTTSELVALHASGLHLLVGPDSDVGRAVAAGRPELARRRLDRWRGSIPDRQALAVEVVHHRGAGDLARAARMFGVAAAAGVPAVLTNAVRYADRSDSATVDVLDAARRLVVLDPRHVDRRTGEGFLKSGKEMAELAEEVAVAAGFGPGEGRRLLARTRLLADRCALDPRRDLGVSEKHFPELSVLLSGDIPADGAGDVTAAGRLDPRQVLRGRCLEGMDRRYGRRDRTALDRLDAELAVIDGLGYPRYFLTVADVVALIRRMQVRCAARGSGAGSLVCYLLGISDVDPLDYGLIMERFLSPLRHQLPDIDLDVESARRTEVYRAILDRYGDDRVACVSMVDTYRARHAIRDVGAALGLPAGEIDAAAKAFPHIRAGQIRAALRDLPELRAARLDADERFDVLFRLAERLDGLPRHIALHPCGVLLSDATLLDRTPVEASWLGFPMSQFDKDDVEELGLLKLDVLGVRMQSSIAHALAEIRRVDGVDVDIDRVPRDDPATFELIRSTRTLGCFQIESPGQRELIGKFGPETFTDLIVDISLFRPGPVKTDMVTPFLEARQGWRSPDFLHDDLRPVLEETCGVVVFHEQVIKLIAVFTGCDLAQADEARRALGDPDGQPEVRAWFRPAALRRGYPRPVVERAWEVLAGFASFGFCKAHAAAFAVPTYQSAWLKAHHPAAFLAGVLSHDPGMYPKRLILDDARQFGIAILPLDVNESAADYRVERVAAGDEPPPAILGGPPRPAPGPPLPDARRYGVRLALSDVRGISDTEVARILANRPYGSLSDFWHRAAVSRPVVERLVVAGGFDALYHIGAALPVRRRGRITRRDLLLQVGELAAETRAPRRGRRPPVAAAGAGADGGPVVGGGAGGVVGGAVGVSGGGGIRELAARQSQAPLPAEPGPVQLALFSTADEATSSGLPEMTAAERVRAELEVLGLDASGHVLTAYEPFLVALGVVRARDLLACRSKTDILVAGVKVATQTPPVRSGRRVVFVTLDDATGPLDATFFEDAQVGYAATLFHSWLLVVRGEVRRTGPRGISLRGLGAWELPLLYEAWRAGGLAAVDELMATARVLTTDGELEAAVQGAAASRSTRPVLSPVPARGAPAGGVGGRPQTYANGFELSPYADLRPAGGNPKDRPPGGRGGSAGRGGRAAPRKLWHASPGSSGG